MPERGYAFRRSKAIVLDRLAGRAEGQLHEWTRRTTNASELAVFETPGGGIAARSGSTLGSATCTKYTVTSGTRASTATTDTVYNDFEGAIGGSRDVIAGKINGIWVAFAEDCNDSDIGVVPLLEHTVS